MVRTRYRNQVSADRLVGRDQRQPLDDRLADEHTYTVEGVAVQVGKLRQLHDGALVDGQRVDAVCLPLPGCLLSKSSGRVPRLLI